MTNRSEYDAVVVGAGPNGLAAAITLARAGRSVLLLEAKETVGGGIRSAELTLPGFVHDVCAAVHPLGLASPFFRSLHFSGYGLEWVHAPAPLAHPLDDGTAVLMQRSVERTAAALGPDASNYRALIEPLARDSEKLVDDLLAPLHIPRHPAALLRFGRSAMHSVDRFVLGRFKGTRARALFGGLGAHVILPMRQPTGTAVGLLLCAVGHSTGWPLARGGSQRIADAMVRCFTDLGGEVRTGIEVHSMGQLPRARVVLLNAMPRQLAEITDDRLHRDYRQHLLAYQHGPGVFKMDWALGGPIPWRAEECLQAATVHVGGTYDEVREAENEVWQGRHPDRPFVLLSQPTLFDPTRAPRGRHIAWAYCHVPNGSTQDMSAQIESQIERFAPGFRDRILARSTMNTADMEAYDRNFVGGDVAGGVQNLLGRSLRPLGRWQPYATPISGLYVCSSSQPPGAGVHGMCGFHAATRALREAF